MSDPFNQPDPNYPPAPPLPTAVTPPIAPPPSNTPLAGGTGDGGGGGKKGGAGKAIAVIVGVLAVGGGAAFAFTSLTGSDDGGGAESPEAAGDLLVQAIADEDVIGVIDLLPEGERQLLGDVTGDVGDEYQRLGVLSDSFTLDGFQGIDVELDGVEFDSEELADGLAWVTVEDGEIEAELDGDGLLDNLGDLVEDVADERDADLDVDDDEMEGDLVDDEDDDELGFAVVEDDGRWYPSVGYTIAELARQDDDDLDEPELDEGVEPDGAADPEAAVQQLVDAAVDLDAEAALAVLDPGEAAALQVYSQFFLDDDDDDDDDDGFEIEAELTDADVDDLGGGVNRVVPTGFEVTIDSGDGGTAELVLDDGCLSVQVTGEEFTDDVLEPVETFDEEFCAGEDVDELLPEDFGDVEISDELQDVVNAFRPIHFGIITVERDGEHFVSPIRTLVDVALGLTRGLEPEDLEEGGAVRALLDGDLDDDLDDVFDQLDETVEDFDEDLDDFDEFDDFEDEGDDVDDATGTYPRTPTGASGPGGELLPDDAVAADLEAGETVEFTAVADAAGGYLVGAQGEANGLDSTVTVLDATTGEELQGGYNDDFFGRDPEVLVELEAGQQVTILVAGWDESQEGDFVVYFEPFGDTGSGSGDDGPTPTTLPASVAVEDYCAAVEDFVAAVDAFNADPATADPADLNAAAQALAAQAADLSGSGITAEQAARVAECSQAAAAAATTLGGG